jgi:hypothetical protein
VLGAGRAAEQIDQHGRRDGDPHQRERTDVEREDAAGVVGGSAVHQLTIAAGLRSTEFGLI